MNKKKTCTWIDQSLCIGCGACIAMDESGTLFMNEDGFAEAKPNELELTEAVTICPTGAVKIKEKPED